MSDKPGDLVPLGIVFNEDDCEQLIEVIDRNWRSGSLELWGYKGRHSPEVKRVPSSHEISWTDGPGREDGDHPEYPGLRYYCDVGAVLRLRADVTGGYLPRAGMSSAVEWTQLRISKKAFDRLCASIRRARKTKRPTPAELDSWMQSNISRFVKRDQTIKACRDDTGSTVRDAAAAFGRLPADRRLGRGKKPSQAGEIER
jgi:hypothetical protein